MASEHERRPLESQAKQARRREMAKAVQQRIPEAGVAQNFAGYDLTFLFGSSHF